MPHMIDPEDEYNPVGEVREMQDSFEKRLMGELQTLREQAIRLEARISMYVEALQRIKQGTSYDDKPMPMPTEGRADSIPGYATGGNVPMRG